MALDPNIILGYRPPAIAPPEIQTPLERYGKMLQLQNLMTQQQAGQLGLEQSRFTLGQEQEQAQRQTKLRDLFARNPNPSRADIYTAAGPVLGTSVIKNLDAQAEQDLKTKHAQAVRRAEIASTAIDAPSFQNAIMTGVSENLFTPEQGRQYAALDWNDPKTQALVKTFGREAMNEAQRHAADLADRTAKRQEDLAGPALDEAKAKALTAGLQNAARTIGPVNDDAAYQAWLPTQTDTVRAWLPKTFSPVVKEQIVTAAEPLKAPVPGVDVPFSPAVIAQRRTEAAAKAQTQADPFNLFGAAGGGAAPAGAVTPTPLAQAIATFEGFDKAGSVAQRNNNPGNLRSGPGQTGTDKNGYAIFPDLNTGWAALHDLIQKRSGDDLTLQEFFGGKKGVYPGYAPAGDRNDPATYAATVAGQLGVEPGAKLADIPGSQAAAVAKPGTRITQDMQGQAVLDALPPALANQIKGYSEGRLTIPTGRALQSGYWQEMLSLISQYDPSFDVANPSKRSATARAFAVGREGQTANAMVTGIGHLAALSKAVDKLNNTWSPTYNTIANFLAEHTGSPVVNDYNTVKKNVVDELTRIWRGTGGNAADIKDRAEVLDASRSPAQLHSAIAKIGDLLESKLSALEDQYRQGMGRIAEGRQIIPPEARKTLDALEQKAAGVQVGTPRSYGKIYVGPNGHRIGSNDGKTWYDVQTGEEVKK